MKKQGHTRRLVPLAVMAAALIGVLPTAAQAGKARRGYGFARHVFALANPASRADARIAATRHIPDPAFAGYQTSHTGVTTVTARYRLPNVKCTKTEAAIGPGVFLLTGPRDRVTFNAANVIFGCYKGQSSAQETLVLNGAETDYSRALGPGDLISVRVSDDPSGHTVVALSDLTRGYTLKRSGRPATANEELVGDWGSVDARTQAPVPPPAFGSTTFRSVSIDGKALGASSPQGYDMQTSSHVLQIVAHAISGSARNTFTCTRTKS